MIRASLYNFVPDAALALRALDSAAISDAYSSPPIALNKLSAYWSTSEWSINKRLRVLVGLASPLPESVDAFRFALEVDSDDLFQTPVEVASVSLTAALVATGAFEMSFDTDDLEYADPEAKFLRLTVTGAGADTALADFSDFLAEGDGFTVNNGLEGGSEVASTVEIGTNAVGSIAIAGGAMTADDAFTIDDGVNDPVTFTYGTDPGEVAVGADAAASATNLAAAIQAAVTAGDLAVGVSDDESGTVTITCLAAFSGLGDAAITEDTDANNRATVTDFTGGNAGISTQAMLELQGLTLTAQIAEIASFLESDSSDEFTTRVDGSRLIIVNTAATSTSIGEITEDQDTNSHLTLTPFSLGSDALKFWAYIRND